MEWRKRIFYRCFERKVLMYNGCNNSARMLISVCYRTTLHLPLEEGYTSDVGVHPAEEVKKSLPLAEIHTNIKNFFIKKNFAVHPVELI
jgi:hypothetical protein